MAAATAVALFFASVCHAMQDGAGHPQGPAIAFERALGFSESATVSPYADTGSPSVSSEHGTRAPREQPRKTAEIINNVTPTIVSKFLPRVSYEPAQVDARSRRKSAMRSLPDGIARPTPLRGASTNVDQQGYRPGPFLVSEHRDGNELADDPLQDMDQRNKKRATRGVLSDDFDADELDRQLSLARVGGAVGHGALRGVAWQSRQTHQQPLELGAMPNNQQPLHSEPYVWHHHEDHTLPGSHPSPEIDAMLISTMLGQDDAHLNASSQQLAHSGPPREPLRIIVDDEDLFDAPHSLEWTPLHASNGYGSHTPVFHFIEKAFFSSNVARRYLPNRHWFERAEATLDLPDRAAMRLAVLTEDDHDFMVVERVPFYLAIQNSVERRRFERGTWWNAAVARSAAEDAQQGINALIFTNARMAGDRVRLIWVGIGRVTRLQRLSPHGVTGLQRFCFVGTGRTVVNGQTRMFEMRSFQFWLQHAPVPSRTEPPPLLPRPSTRRPSDVHSDVGNSGQFTRAATNTVPHDLWPMSNSEGSQSEAHYFQRRSERDAVVHKSLYEGAHSVEGRFFDNEPFDSIKIELVDVQDNDVKQFRLHGKTFAGEDLYSQPFYVKEVDTLSATTSGSESKEDLSHLFARLSAQDDKELPIHRDISQNKWQKRMVPGFHGAMAPVPLVTNVTLFNSVEHAIDTIWPPWRIQLHNPMLGLVENVQTNGTYTQHRLDAYVDTQRFGTVRTSTLFYVPNQEHPQRRSAPTQAATQRLQRRGWIFDAENRHLQGPAFKSFEETLLAAQERWRHLRHLQVVAVHRLLLSDGDAGDAYRLELKGVMPRGEEVTKEFEFYLAPVRMPFSNIVFSSLPAVRREYQSFVGQNVTPDLNSLRRVGDGPEPGSGKYRYEIAVHLSPLSVEKHEIDFYIREPVVTFLARPPLHYLPK